MNYTSFLKRLRRVFVTGAVLYVPFVLGSVAFAQAPRVICEPAGTLGTFEPTPYILVGGAAPIAGGYSPLGTYGDTSLSLNGPVASLRSVSAPVVTYSRGYDGVVRQVQGTSSSTPNLPLLSPFAYPTRRSNYYAPRTSPPLSQWTSGSTWIDQN
ncbi:hypothetical protein [Paludisphaera rhizosphaerae]|uniref:hypothetical protein n=1 Tax=Paludisphaera rhizosphaerae TaxID=2711216 RepID=UPI0013ED0EB2|nr:hypothetical protein [Paludisphaera rhizosphaerae]